MYDRAGRLHEVEAEGGTTTYSYYDNGRLEMVEYPNGSTEEYYYYYDNTLNRLVNRESDGTEIESFSYTYDNANNQTSKTDSRGTTNYTYDDLERLETVAEPDGKETEYTFDLAGNRGTETQSVYDEVYGNPIQTIKITVYDYDSLNRLLSTSTTADGAQTEYVTFTYDDNGNQLTVNRSVYEDVYNQNTFVTINMFDNLNQLTRTETPEGKVVQNKYNGEGKRVSKTVDGDERKYLYEADKVILETDGSGNQKARNVQGTNLISRTIDDLTGYYFYNGHGDVTVINDVYGDTILGYYYDAFGNPETVTDSVYGSVYGGGFNNPFLYAGYLWDSETGTYYLMARMYDPEIGRFISEDSYRGNFTDVLSLNLYTYAHNEPIMYTDPDGHKEVITKVTYTEEYFAGYGKQKIRYRAIENGKLTWKIRNGVKLIYKTREITVEEYTFTNLNVSVYKNSDGSGTFNTELGFVKKTNGKVDDGTGIAAGKTQRGYYDYWDDKSKKTIKGSATKINELQLADKRIGRDNSIDWLKTGISVGADIAFALKAAKANTVYDVVKAAGPDKKVGTVGNANYATSAYDNFINSTESYGKKAIGFVISVMPIYGSQISASQNAIKHSNERVNFVSSN